MNHIVAIVPIRHHSQRVSGKNYKLLGPYPLYYHILRTLLKTNKFNQIIVDTDSFIVKQGIQYYFGNSIQVVDRAANLTGDTISMNDILLAIIDKVKLDDNTVIFQTHVTNPFLTETSIKNALDDYLVWTPNREYERSFMSVTSYKNRLWDSKFNAINHNPAVLIQTQDLPLYYEENSCFYIFHAGGIRKYKTRLCKTIEYYLLKKPECLDIDDPEDFEIADAVYRNYIYKNGLNDVTLLNLNHSDNTIYSELVSEFQQEIKNKIPYVGIRVLISAPYMMPNIAAFKNFLQNDLGMDVIVAKVEERLSEEDLAKYNGLYDIALIGDDAFTFDLIGSTGVKCICKWGTGIDSISKPGCQKYNISLRNTVDAFSEPVAETMMAALLSFIRGTHRSTLMMGYSDAWTKIQGRTLDEVSVGIIGLGNVGCNFANKLSHYKTKIYGYDILVDACFRATREADVIILSGIDELLNKADIVCLCCDYNDDNYHLINYNRLSLMKHGSYLINMARGKLIDLDALTDSLLVGKLAGVALDVFEIEPLPMESALRKMPNVILSSHNANSSPKYWMNVHKNTIRNALKYLRGE